MLQEISPVKIDLSPSNVNNEPVTVGDWLLTYFLLSLPVVNLIMLFVWAFNQSEKQSKSNWAKAFDLDVDCHFHLFVDIGAGGSKQVILGAYTG